MNQFRKAWLVLLLVGFTSTASAANVDTYWYWNLETGEDWINTGALWTSEDGSSTGYVPGTTPNGADTYRDWAVIRNVGLVKIDDSHNPWGLMAANFPQNIWVGHGSTVYHPGPFAPSAGHVLQTSGDVGYQSYVIVGRDQAPGTSTYEMQGGSLTQQYSGTGYVIIGHRYSAGTMTMSNNAKVVTMGGANICRVGDGPAAVGTLSMTDTAEMAVSYLTAAQQGAEDEISTGTVNLTGDAKITALLDVAAGYYYYSNGAINLSGNSRLTVGRRLNVGDNSSYDVRGAAGTGHVSIADNAILTTSEVRLGKYQYGVGTMSVASTIGTATLNVGSEMTIGWSGGHGTLTVGDGGVVNHDYGWVAVGSGLRTDPDGLEIFTSTGTVIMNGGTFNHTDATTGIAIGIDGQTGTWTQNGGSLVSAAPIRFGHGGGHAMLDLNGGTFQVPSITVDQDLAPAVARVNFNGGTLKAGAAGELLVDSPSPTLALMVQAGGAVVDSNGYDVAISPALVEDPHSTGGGLTKLGAGKLTLNGANAYSGDTIASAGTLSVTGNQMLADDAALRIALGAVMDLNFSGTDTIGGLYLDGIAQAQGTWGAPGSGATFTNGTYFSGTGILLVETPSPPVPGDANGDGKVNATDAQALATNWGVASGASWAMGDFNDDGAVNAADASIMAANWGDHTGEAQSAVPEPSTWASLAGLALLGMALLRRRG